MMINYKLFLILGIIIIIIPFLGIPQTFKTIMFFVIGLFLLVIYVALKNSYRKRFASQDDEESVYVENEEVPEAEEDNEEAEYDEEAKDDDVLGGEIEEDFETDEAEMEDDKKDDEEVSDVNKFDKYFTDD